MIPETIVVWILLLFATGAGGIGESFPTLEAC